MGSRVFGDTGGVRIHLDTDLGGDPDDASALAMLLGWDGVETADRHALSFKA
jgi:hypothetical protein